MNARVAGSYGVPVALATGDDAFAKEIRTLLDGDLETVVVKRHSAGMHERGTYESHEGSRYRRYGNAPSYFTRASELRELARCRFQLGGSDDDVVESVRARSQIRRSIRPNGVSGGDAARSHGNEDGLG